MGLTSLQVCMDSSDWLQEAESSGGSILLDHSSSSSSPSAVNIFAAASSRPPPSTATAAATAAAAVAMIDGGRRLRPPHDHPQKCPRCESTHTKFCYYNNYSLSQPRYFCKTCRRYWTHGGTLRNIPVGGGSRKPTKKPSSSNKKTDHAPHAHPHQNYQNAPPGLVPHLSAGTTTTMMMMGPYRDHGGGFLESKYGGGCGGLLLPHHHNNPSRPIDFLDSKFDLMGMNNDFSVADPAADVDQHIGVSHEVGLNHGGVHGFHCGTTGIMQDIMLTTYDHHHHGSDMMTGMDVKPSPKLLSLDWQQDQVCSDAGKESSAASYGGYINGLGSSWNYGFINGYGSSTKTNSLL